MENEYVFNYDEVKRRFESVPTTNSMSKKFKSTTYKTFFQPRTKSVSNKNEIHSNMNPILANRPQRLIQMSKVTLQMHVVCVQPVIPVEDLYLQTQQGFYLIPTLMQ